MATTRIERYAYKIYGEPAGKNEPPKKLELCCYVPEACNDLNWPANPPILLHFQGNGFQKWLGWRECESYLRELSEKLDWIVIDVQLRTNQQHRVSYPTAHDEALEAYKYVRKHAGKERRLPGNPNLIGLMGHSSGGHVAASLALRLKQENLPLPQFVVLYAPSLDFSSNLPKYKYFGHTWDKSNKLLHLTGCDADDLKGLPPHLFMLAGLDAYDAPEEFKPGLTEHAFTYANLLHKAGVRVTARYWRLRHHFFFHYAGFRTFHLEALYYWMYQAMRGIEPTTNAANVKLPHTYRPQPLWLLNFFNQWIVVITRTLYIMTRLACCYCKPLLPEWM